MATSLSVTDDTGTVTFGYDDLDRLVSAAYPGSQAYAWTYDAVGNILTADSPSGSKTFSYDLADRITCRRSGVAYRRQRQPRQPTAATAATRSATTPWVRLIGVVGSGLSHELHARRRRQPLWPRPYRRHHHLVRPRPAAAQPDHRSSPTASRDYLPATPPPASAPTAPGRAPSPIFAGSPLLSVTETGATDRPRCGSTRTGSRAPLAPRLRASATRASGRTLTGLVNLRFRAYDPALLRFTGRDTWGGIAIDPGSANRYAYAQGNPLRYTDPSGHFVQTLVDNPAEGIALAVDVSPLGLAHWGVSAALGYDPLTGRTLEPWERTVAAVAVAAIPGSPPRCPGVRAGPAGPRPSHAASSGSPARHGSPTTSSPDWGRLARSESSDPRSATSGPPSAGRAWRPRRAELLAGTVGRGSRPDHDSVSRDDSWVRD